MDQGKENNGQAQAALTLEMLGLTQRKLQDAVIDQAVELVMKGVSLDEEGDEYERDSSFISRMRKKVQEQIEATINKLAAEHVLPNVANYIETLSLQATTKWGEPRGEKLTFTEYLVQRAEAYMAEDVNYEGKSKSEVNGYSWNKSQSRITYLIEKHLQYSINTAMEGAMKSVNEQISEGIAKTVKIQLQEITEKLRPVAPKVGR